MAYPIENIVARLRNEHLWEQCYPHHEMTMNKSGRPVFPMISYSVSGLDPEGLYAFVIRLERVDGRLYKFENGQLCSEYDCVPSSVDFRQPILHGAGFRRGILWMRNHVPFHDLKIAYDPNFANSKNTIALHSRRKYVPLLQVFQMRNDREAVMVHEYLSPLHEFIAVHTYLNNEFGAVKQKMRNHKAMSILEMGRWRENMAKDPFSINISQPLVAPMVANEPEGQKDDGIGVAEEFFNDAPIIMDINPEDVILIEEQEMEEDRMDWDEADYEIVRFRADDSYNELAENQYEGYQQLVIEPNPIDDDDDQTEEPFEIDDLDVAGDNEFVWRPKLLDPATISLK